MTVKEVGECSKRHREEGEGMRMTRSERKATQVRRKGSLNGNIDEGGIRSEM